MDSTKQNCHQAGWLVILLIILFALFFSALAIQQHRTFQTNGLDLGNVDQALWNTAQGRFLHFTLMTPVQSRLALHVEPILLTFVPLYWLNLGSPELLLVVQAAVVFFSFLFVGLNLVVDIIYTMLDPRIRLN